MAQPVPTFAQEAYAVLRGRYGDQPFESSYLSWFVSKAMAKKTLHVLERAGWIRRVDKGRYVCIEPNAVFAELIKFRVPGLLAEAARPYAYADASAVEVWTDFTYLQRSWEHSPYVVKVQKTDVDFWVSCFRARKVKVFVAEAEPSIGEFVVLRPQARLHRVEHNGIPVEPLEDVVRFCEQHVETFEYPLAYLKAKHRVRIHVTLDPRVLSEAMEA